MGFTQSWIWYLRECHTDGFYRHCCHLLANHACFLCGLNSATVVEFVTNKIVKVSVSRFSINTWNHLGLKLLLWGPVLKPTVDLISWSFGLWVDPPELDGLWTHTHINAKETIVQTSTYGDTAPFHISHTLRDSFESKWVFIYCIREGKFASQHNKAKSWLWGCFKTSSY